MARGYMYEISPNKENLGTLEEYGLSEKLCCLSTDYVELIKERDSVRDSLFSYLMNYGAKIMDDGILITREVKMNCFKERFETTKKLVAEMDLETFATSTLDTLKINIEDTYGHCVWVDSFYYHLDYWLRTCEENVVYYVGNIFLIH